MAAYAQKVYDALVAVPRAPGIQVEIDTASLTALDTMLKNKEVTLVLTQSGPEAILQGTATYTMKDFIQNIGFSWDSTNKYYHSNVSEDGALQDAVNELKDMSAEWGIAFADNTM